MVYLFQPTIDRSVTGVWQQVVGNSFGIVRRFTFTMLPVCGRPQFTEGRVRGHRGHQQHRHTQMVSH